MRLKKILGEIDYFVNKSEDKKKKVVGELDEILQSGDWIVRKPVLYRGRDWNGYVKIKDTEVYERRIPRDTPNEIDFLIHDFTVNCHPDYPDRWQSRFALTYEGDADVFGEHNYIIFPHKNSKIVYSNIDSYDILVEQFKRHSYLKGIFKFYESYENDSETVAYRRNKDKISDEMQRLLYALYGVYTGEEIAISDYGCPEKIYHQLIDQRNQLKKGSTDQFKLRKGLNQLSDFFKDIIMEYYSLYDKGYPENKEQGKGEVIFQGKYVQVHSEVYNYYMKNKGN